MKQKQPLLLGAHMSIAGGLQEAIKRGVSLGCTTMQIFTTNNRQWYSKPLSQEVSNGFAQDAKHSCLHTIVSHASYLINLGSPDPLTEKKSIDALIQELERCAALKIPYIVLHPGSRLHVQEDICVKQVAQNLDRVLSASPKRPMILLETMAGQGSTIGNSFEHLAMIRTLSTYTNRIGVCFDTCHVFAAGYDFSTLDTYHSMWNEFDTTVGLKHLKAIHINDSKKALGSRVDRHEHIGKGKIGLDAFSFIINDPQLAHIPKILETPKDSLADDKNNMEILKDLNFAN